MNYRQRNAKARRHLPSAQTDTCDPTREPVPEFRMKRARRILWECKQQPEWARTQAAFFKHPSLRNVAYQVLKQLVKESED